VTDADAPHLVLRSALPTRDFADHAVFRRPSQARATLPIPVTAHSSDHNTCSRQYDRHPSPHLIQVLERRTEDVSDERKRLLARQALRERKADEAYQDWLRQLRDRAYVEYRLEDQ